MMHEGKMHDELDLLDQAEADTERTAGEMTFASDLDRRQFVFLSLVTAAATTFGFGAKALAQGLTFRPLAVTAKDTLDWHKTRPPEERKAMDDGAVAGIPASKETEVLALWHAKQKNGS